LVRGIGLVNLVHANVKDFFPIDYRIYGPETDGKTKNDHFKEMVVAAVSGKGIQAKTVLFDSWYASAENLKQIHRLKLRFVTKLKKKKSQGIGKQGIGLHSTG
jgi:hypothetical protein